MGLEPGDDTLREVEQGEGGQWGLSLATIRFAKWSEETGLGDSSLTTARSVVTSRCDGG
jgi:hypothetical protein